MLSQPSVMHSFIERMANPGNGRNCASPPCIAPNTWQGAGPRWWRCARVRRWGSGRGSVDGVPRRAVGWWRGGSSERLSEKRQIGHDARDARNERAKVSQRMTRGQAVVEDRADKRTDGPKYGKGKRDHVVGLERIL